MKTIAQQLNVKEFPFEIKDKNGNQIYFEGIHEYWIKREFDSNGDTIYYETSNGYIIDNRPQSIPEYTMEELTKMLGKEFKIKK